MKYFLLSFVLVTLGCSSSSSNRYPASRAGREYQEPKVMNRHRTDTETLFQNCVKEWPELYCRNRMGR